MNILATYDDLINELTICGKTIDDFKMDLSKYENDLDEWKEGFDRIQHIVFILLNKHNILYKKENCHNLVIFQMKTR